MMQTPCAKITIDFTVAAATIEEAQPTIDSFAEFLRQFGEVEVLYVGVYYKFPDNIMVQISIRSATATIETIDRMARDLQPPISNGREGSNGWGWSARNQGGGYMPKFPKIDWIYVSFYSGQRHVVDETDFDKRYPELYELFDTCSQMGWEEKVPEDSEFSAVSVLNEYFRDRSDVQLLQLQRVLREFMKETVDLSDEKLGKALSLDFNSTYIAPRARLTNRAWLNKVDKQLDDTLKLRMSLP